jgi:UDP-N-acetylglucosamine acyltransferase
MIHPTAIIEPGARIGEGTVVGAYAVVEQHVTVGRDCIVAPHVHLTGHTTIGDGNHFHTGCVIGDGPQDLKYHGDPTRLLIGHRNIFREHVTVHRANSLDEATVVGSDCLFMANAHVGHNSHVGDRVIMANGVLLGGHVVIEDRAILSGNCLVHQFARVGTLAMMQGGSAVSKDLPPFTVARGGNGISGLNSIGLRRAGYSSEQRLELRRLYHALFRSGKPLRAAVVAAEGTFTGEPARALLAFVAASKRGVCADRGVRHREPQETAEPL